MSNQVETTLPKTNVTKTEGLLAFEELRRQASDVADMGIDEINSIISETRKNRRK